MRETLMVIGLALLAAALRSSQHTLLRKTGALTLMATSFCLLYFLTDNIVGGIIGAGLWFFLPWFELLTRIRGMRLPIENRLRQRTTPHPSYFPNASEAVEAMEEEGFEHISDCGWTWDGMRQHFQLYWNAEERAVATICFCEQADVAFAFLSLTSQCSNHAIWRTTNFPFAPTLRRPPNVNWNYVPCEGNDFQQLLRDHRAFLNRKRIAADDLRIPDPEEIEKAIEEEMRKQVEHNLTAGIIHLTGDGHFRYSKRGLLFLWGQFLKDLVRFC